MGKHFTSIEINGKLYDARTGKLISGSQAAHRPSEHTQKKASPQHVQDIAPRITSAKIPHRTLERSKTLMRHAVKRPAKSAAPKAAHAVSAVAPAITVFTDFKRPTTLSHSTDADREIRAAKVKKSTLVRKFSDMSMPGGKTANTYPVQSMAVKPVPAHAEPPRHAHPKTQSVLEKGLKNAQSHTQEYKTASSKKHRSKAGRRARLASIGAGSLAVLLLVGFFGYQNIPNISMRYATTRAGVNATLPGYKPSGFALNNHIQYNPGQVTVKFKSNTDERAFTITQRESAWNSDTLRQNYVATAGAQVHTFEDKGRTIYLYGGSNATWVNGGVWYDIQGDAQLNSDQLIRIATSM